jgi:small conductance mechanosensitive channel
VPPERTTNARKALRDMALRRGISPQTARRAAVQLLVILPLIAAVLVLYNARGQLFGPEWDTAVRLITAVSLVALGWQLARDIGRALGPTLLRRLDPPTAGTLGFVIRLATMVVVLVVTLHVAGIGPRTLAVGGALTAIVGGLAAQQTLGNLIAGTVLLSARPFRVGDRVRLQGGPLAGTLEGVVGALGLLYTTLAQGDDQIMVPNAVVLSCAVVPLREPAGVDLRARLWPGVTPVQVQRLLERRVTVPIRGRPSVALEEIDADHVGVRVTAAPVDPADGAQLATEVMEAIARYAIAPPQDVAHEHHEDGPEEEGEPTPPTGPAADAALSSGPSASRPARPGT